MVDIVDLSMECALITALVVMNSTEPSVVSSVREQHFACSTHTRSIATNFE